ncbi:MAG TPA: pyrroloquinoline quinone-dependent dehydrogenase [Acidobacteriota bacterium]|jgi:quinoprotein glucose dehydrogenase
MIDLQRLSIFGVLLTAFSGMTAVSPRDLKPGGYDGWRVYGGDSSGSRYSSLDQIDRTNVNRLKVAWVYHTLDNRIDPPSTIECSPIVVDGIMYLTSPALKVIALDAATGSEIWRFDAFSGSAARGVSRGVTYWESGEVKRILLTAGSYLYSLDARTGKPVTDFGAEGKVDLRLGLDRDIGGADFKVTTPGVVYRDLIILGSSVGEGPQPAAPGHIQAYDIRTGKRAWAFHTIPHPGEFGYETWESDSWQKAGGANNWGGMTVDPERGMVFVSTGSPTFDFYGGDRKGQNLFGNCVLALNASTGARAWHFQTVHHDIWDYDLPCPPNLVTVNHDGKAVDAVAQVTKTGLIFVLDRDTGQPLFPVEERPVPPSQLEGEQAWPTQPFPLKPPPLTRNAFTEKEITNISKTGSNYVRRRLRQLHSTGIFTPPSEEGTVVFPGYHGGVNWHGAAFDPTTGVLYANVNEIPFVVTMKKIEPLAEGRIPLGKSLYQLHCASCHGLQIQREKTRGSSLEPIRPGLSSRAMLQLIEKGRGRMPAFGFTPDEKTALVAFLSGEEIQTARSYQSRIGRPYPYKYVFTGYYRFLDDEGYPAIKPPWATLNAVDLNSGEFLWRVPLGEVPQLKARGVRHSGTETFGGCIVTAGGLVFIGASKDRKFRAFDKATGKILWETDLPAGGMATPATYAVKGKQYIVVAAGGGAGNRVRDLLDKTSGDAFIAFALP